MKYFLIISLLAVALSSCDEIGPSRERLVTDCMETIETHGTLDEVLLVKYCKCAADTLMQVFSEYDIDKHLHLEDRERYKRYQTHIQHCILILTEPLRTDSLRRKDSLQVKPVSP